MPLIKAVDRKPRCAGVWAYGPSKGQPCNDWHNLIKCNHVLDPGCELYFCLAFHWHDHWDTHDNDKYLGVGAEMAAMRIQDEK